MSRVAAVPPLLAAATCISGDEPGSGIRTLKAGAAIFMEGETVDRIHELVSGIVRLSKATPDGRRQILGFLFAGAVFTPSGLAFSNDGCASCSADTVTEVKTVSHRLSSFSSMLAARPDLTRDLLAAAGRTLAQAQHQMLLLGRMSARERMIWFLLKMAEQQNVNDDTEIHLPMSRLDIADYLGLSAETVSRALRWLREQKIITIEEAVKIRIVDPTSARQIAEGSSANLSAVRYGLAVNRLRT